jgi:hypothetical protein
MKKIFEDKYGDLRWSPFFGALSLVILIAWVAMKPDLGVAFGQRFFRSGFWMLLLPVIAYFVYAKAKKSYDKEQDGRGYNTIMIVALVILASGLLGVSGAIKNDQSSNVPDEMFVHYNGYIPKPAVYFEYFSLSAVDSQYVVDNHEEPGVNNWAIRDAPSTKLRANEDWRRPVSKKALDLKGKY